MSTITAFFLVLGAISFLFMFWRRLKEDYAASMIFSAGFLMIIGSVVFLLLSKFLLSKVLTASNFFNLQGLWFWVSLMGFSLGLVVSIYKYKLRIFETIEAAGVAAILWLVLAFLGLAISSLNYFFLVGAGFLLLLFIAFFFIDAHYKNFSWYKSGRVGFSGLTVIGLLFLARGVIATIFPSMIFLVGKVDIILSATAAFLTFFSVFNLAKIKA